MEQIYSPESKWKLSIPRIAALGMLLSLTITMKYALGFVPGIELVSFLFIIYGIFLPTLDLTLLIVCFNLLVLVLYGFGSWWFAYWIIWPIDAFASKLLSKATRNKYVFSSLGFMLGASVGFWYFWSDAIMFGWRFAYLNIFTAIPVNLIEGLTTMLMVIITGPALMKVINRYSVYFWSVKPYEFKTNKYHKLNVFLNVFLGLSMITSIVILFIYNFKFIQLKQEKSRKDYSQHRLKEDEKTVLIKSSICNLSLKSIYKSERGNNAKK